MELEKIRDIEEATWVNRKEIFRLGVAVLFIVGIMLYLESQGEISNMLIIVRRRLIVSSFISAFSSQ